ncbi:flavodoxin-dependent (E)-4-hydroxy-3-methylbut-2-enyl-diphosphate synthase [Fannyhessea vaginae]|uniref:flavodoxin-dependent (E)-4-hydroxy-3-methylbut-2-enyl-diphosphate synthase n=1 Tax=Fannyhessea vaginae TaxID=82135 RepID=UPI0023F46611|nr:flavodoxin-dependent (E)-4-hydroxy-3-methylbut-2-enyl-diphosphate synthase [Fannyhessea vaginae]
MKARSKTHQVFVGDVAVGGGAPVSVQSMCTTKTSDAAATLEQINKLMNAGCELIRVAIPLKSDLDGFEEICHKSPLPVIADIHFDYRLAIEAAERGASALRINPGNIGSMEKVDKVIDAAKQAHIPIRIGVNAGSLDRKFDARDDLTLSQKMIASATGYVEHFRDRGFNDIVLSAKAHSVPTTLETYRNLSQALPDIPLHVGVTEAGGLRQGTVKNCVGVGILLEQGIGDTIRLSLTADPVEEVYVAWDLLSSLGMRRLTPEMVSCPTCGRCQVNLIEMANVVSERLAKLKAPISVAVMGCAVNGPGEARDADIGVACGKDKGVLFQNGKPIRSVAAENIVSELFKEIQDRYGYDVSKDI